MNQRNFLKNSFTIPVVSTMMGFTLFTSGPTQAANIASVWSFDFTGDITGEGTINLNLEDFDSATGSYLVTEIDFTLNFGVTGDPQAISLSDFVTRKPFRFNPTDSDNELYSTFFGSVQPSWGLGILDNLGTFIMSGSSSGMGLPPDPDGVGGVIAFTPQGSGTVSSTGSWTAKPVPEPNSLTLVGAVAIIGVGSLFQRKFKASKAITIEGSSDKEVSTIH